MVPTIKVDTTNFERTLAEYMMYSRRTLVEAINEKAFFIARHAVHQTKKASERDIRTLFGQSIQLRPKQRGSGWMRGKKSQTSTFNTKGDRVDAPLFPVIINKRRGKGRGLYGKAMQVAAQRAFNARIRSIAFIRSGWLPAIRHLEQFSKYKRGAPPVGGGDAREYGKPKGGAEEAKPGDVVAARIWNDVGSQASRSKNVDMQKRIAAVVQWGSRGLNAAFALEVSSMNDYLERKMKVDADRFNAAAR